MADITSHPLYPVAQAFSRLPPGRNPLRNAQARRNMPQHLAPHVDAIASHPELSAVATGASTSMSTTNGGTSMASGPAVTGGQGPGQTEMAATQSTMKRLPDVRHQVCGMPGVVFAGAGSLPGTFSPQTRFKPNRLVIPSTTLAGTSISNLLVGTKPQYAAASTENFDFFEEQSTAGMWDMDVCEIGQKVQMTITVTGATTVFAALIGEALDGKPYPMLRSPLKRIATRASLSNGGAAVAAGATVAVQVTPQVRFKTRKLVTDDATAKFFNINFFNVGITPQLISGDPAPSSAFTEVAQDIWLDCDEAYIGNLITISITNTDAAAHDLGISLLGDVDPRDLASAYGYYT